MQTRPFHFLHQQFADFAVQSLQELRSKGVVRQNYEESCGASALATLINLWDSKQLSELDIIKYLSTNETDCHGKATAEAIHHLERSIRPI